MRKYGKYEKMPEGVPAKQPKVKSALLQTYLTSLLCMVLCVSMFFGTSYAWFTSEVTNEGNEIYIGVLDVKLLAGDKDLSEEGNELFDDGICWEPGYTSVKKLQVVENGDLAFNYELTFTDGKIDGKTDDQLLAVAKWFDVWVYHDSDNTVPAVGRYEDITDKDSGWEKVGTLAEVLNGKTVFEGKMDAEDVVGEQKTAHTYTIALHMVGENIEAAQEDELNALMGKRLELSVKLVATQRSSEKDSFGDSYYDNPNAVYTVEELQKALDDATGNTVIALAADINGDVTVTQKENVQITIEGNDHKFDGFVTVNGKSARYETAGLTIKNVVFTGVSGEDSGYICLGKKDDNSTRYTNNVTIKNCTFNGNDEGENRKTAAVRSFTGGDWNLVVDGCTIDNRMHSMLQIDNVEKGLKITNCKVYSKNGINLNSTPSLEMSGCTFEVEGYAVRFGQKSGTPNESMNFTLTDNILKTSAIVESGDAVIIFRGDAVKATLNIKNTTLEGVLVYKGADNVKINEDNVTKVDPVNP